MAIKDDYERAKRDWPEHIALFKELFGRLGITDYRSLTAGLKEPVAREEIKRAIETVMAKEGGKLSLASVGLLIGASLGGAGFAAMGGAIPVSLSLLGLLAGLFVGNECDATGLTKKFGKSIKGGWNYFRR